MTYSVFLYTDSERTGIVNTVAYDRAAKGYRLETLYKTRLCNSEVLALCKIFLDRLPTAQILDEAEVFETGIDMWIRSQGNYVELIQ